MKLSCECLLTSFTGVYFTGGSLNPARSFGPSVVLHEFYHYHWIYWLGPILGSFVAAGFYMFIKMLEYETANPGQDLDDKEAQVFDPEVSTERPNVTLHQADYVAQPDGKVAPAQPQGGRRSRDDRGSNSHSQGRPHSNSASRGQLDRSPRRSREYTYPATDGAAPYMPDGTATYVVGGTTAYVPGATTNYVPGSTTNYVSGGTANYVPRTSHDSYRRGPDVESGRYASRSAARY